MKGLFKEYIRKMNYKEIIYIMFVLIGIYIISLGVVGMIKLHSSSNTTKQTLINDKLLNAYRIKDNLSITLLKTNKEIINKQDLIIDDLDKKIIQQDITIKSLMEKIKKQNDYILILEYKEK